MLNRVHLLYFWYENRSKFHLSFVFVWFVDHRPVSAIFTRRIDVGKPLFNLTSFGEEAANVRYNHRLIHFMISSSLSNFWVFWFYCWNTKRCKVFILTSIKNFPYLRIKFFLLLNFFLYLQSKNWSILSNRLKIVWVNLRIHSF